jgi:hypothetical protein
MIPYGAILAAPERRFGGARLAFALGPTNMRNGARRC